MWQWDTQTGKGFKLQHGPFVCDGHMIVTLIKTSSESDFEVYCLGNINKTHLRKERIHATVKLHTSTWGANCVKCFFLSLIYTTILKCVFKRGSFESCPTWTNTITYPRSVPSSFPSVKWKMIPAAPTFLASLRHSSCLMWPQTVSFNPLIFRVSSVSTDRQRN